MGKARVAPIKRMTTPKLELQAAVYGAQLAQFIKEEQDIEYSHCVFWSDSTAVLYWLRTPEMRHRKFVANRIAKILDLSSAFNWKYVSSTANPADDGIRGYSVEQMTSKSRWISGPSFLSQRRSEWLKQEVFHGQQVKVISFSSVNSAVSNIVDVTRFSSWKKIIRVRALCILFANKCRKRHAEMKFAHFTRAYLHVIHNIQRQDFNPEYMLLKNRIDVYSTSRLKSLSPSLDKNNQLRARGRLAKASLLTTARHPIILDGNNAAVKLLVQHTHENNCHCGPEQTRNTLMKCYWILRCRAVVKQTIRRCLPCRRMQQDVSNPQIADLPKERLPKKNQFVFETTGLNFIGPFPVKNNGRLSSRYILLLACLVVRAVHLEISNDLTRDSTINCIRRFISRRGKPNKFVSDCGKSFVCSNNALQSSIVELKESKLLAAKLHSMNVEIYWKFNPPTASHFGGIWERLVQFFKLSLYKVIGIEKFN